MFSEENKEVTMKLIYYSALMVILPILTFYFLYIVVFDWDVLMLEWCGLAAVIVANLVIFAYVRMAWQEDSGSGSGDDDGEAADDKNDSQNQKSDKTD